jgi:hypothetical protein
VKSRNYLRSLLRNPAFERTCPQSCPCDATSLAGGTEINTRTSVHCVAKSHNFASRRGTAVKREIKAREALQDIRHGMNDLELMEKYRITDKGIRSLFMKLVAVGLLSPDEIDRRDATFVSTVTLDLEDLNLP